MITYYDDRSVRVTSETLRVGDRAYPLRGLTRVWQQRGARRWGSLAGRGALGVALIGPLAVAAIGILLAFRLDTSTTTTIAIVGGSVLVGLATGPIADLLFERLDRSYARGLHDLQLWADVRGRPVLLLHTHDALRFGQICRALQRARELPRSQSEVARGHRSVTTRRRDG